MGLPIRRVRLLDNVSGRVNVHRVPRLFVTIYPPVANLASYVQCEVNLRRRPVRVVVALLSVLRRPRDLVRAVKRRVVLNRRANVLCARLLLKQEAGSRWWSGRATYPRTRSRGRATRSTWNALPRYKMGTIVDSNLEVVGVMSFARLVLLFRIFGTRRVGVLRGS